MVFAIDAFPSLFGIVIALGASVAWRTKRDGLEVIARHATRPAMMRLGWGRMPTCHTSQMFDPAHMQQSLPAAVGDFRGL
jgi:hypothetical protein